VTAQSGIDRTTTVVTLVDIVAGLEDVTPAILACTSVRLKNGGRRTITQRIPVPDPTLFRRLVQEAAKGDELRITVETDWNAPGLPVRLTDFQRVGAGLVRAATA
jgi:hypothetical protein